MPGTACSLPAALPVPQGEATVEAAAEILLAKIAHPMSRQRVVRTIQPLLVVRGSTGRARSSAAVGGRSR